MNDTGSGSARGAATLDAVVVRAFHDRLDDPVATDDPWAEMRALEELRNAISARQARLVMQAHAEQRDADDRRRIARQATTRLVGS
ncbi:hypothetical protein, partial [Flexivirga sp.]|uniref:hypothetical protein n=1 Tax=Flexivirga sp. TaxID=1962927 RepID=UPI003F8118DD